MRAASGSLSRWRREQNGSDLRLALTVVRTLADARALHTGSNGIPLDVPTYAVWGANTSVGKTLVSLGLAHAAQRLQVRVRLRD